MGDEKSFEDRVGGMLIRRVGRRLVRWLEFKKVGVL